MKNFFISSKWFCFTVALLPSLTFAQGGVPVPFEPKPDQHADERCAILTVHKTAIHGGEELKVEVRLINDALLTYHPPGDFDRKEDFRSNVVTITIVK